jgi:hypothetical protein
MAKILVFSDSKGILLLKSTPGRKFGQKKVEKDPSK